MKKNYMNGPENRDKKKYMYRNTVNKKGMQLIQIELLDQKKTKKYKDMSKQEALKHRNNLN